MELDVIKKIKVNKMNSFQLLFVCLGSVVVLLSDSSISEGHAYQINNSTIQTFH